MCTCVCVSHTWPVFVSNAICETQFGHPSLRSLFDRCGHGGACLAGSLLKIEEQTITYWYISRYAEVLTALASCNSALHTATGVASNLLYSPLFIIFFSHLVIYVHHDQRCFVLHWQLQQAHSCYQACKKKDYNRKQFSCFRVLQLLEIDN